MVDTIGAMTNGSPQLLLSIVITCSSTRTTSSRVYSSTCCSSVVLHYGDSYYFVSPTVTHTDTGTSNNRNNQYTAAVLRYIGFNGIDTLFRVVPYIGMYACWRCIIAADCRCINEGLKTGFSSLMQCFLHNDTHPVWMLQTVIMNPDKKVMQIEYVCRQCMNR